MSIRHFVLIGAVAFLAGSAAPVQNCPNEGAEPHIYVVNRCDGYNNCLASTLPYNRDECIPVPNSACSTLLDEWRYENLYASAGTCPNCTMIAPPYPVATVHIHVVTKVSASCDYASP